MKRKKKEEKTTNSYLDKTPDEIKKEFDIMNKPEIKAIEYMEEELEDEEVVTSFPILSWRQADLYDVKTGKALPQKFFNAGPELAEEVKNFLRASGDHGVASYRYLANGNVSVVSYPSYQKRELRVPR